MKRFMVMSLFVLSMTGCASMNESFSCNETATDSCLTIDEVNAMTEPKGNFKKQSVFHQAQNSSSSDEVLWLSENKVEVR